MTPSSRKEAPSPRRDACPNWPSSLIGAFPLVDLNAHPDAALMKACGQATCLIERVEKEGTDIWTVPALPWVVELHRLAEEIIQARPRFTEGVRAREIFMAQDVAAPENRAISIVITRLYNEGATNAVDALIQAEHAYDAMLRKASIRRDPINDEIIMLASREGMDGRPVRTEAIFRACRPYGADGAIRRRLSRLTDVGLLAREEGHSERDFRIVATDKLMAICRNRLRMLAALAFGLRKGIRA